MTTLKGDKIYLRALEFDDLEFIYGIENDETVWGISNTQTPFSKYILKKYLENATKDIYEVKQLRLVISDYNHTPYGFIDLYDFDFKNKRAGVGIVVKKNKRRKGIGSEALQLLTKYSFTHLNLHQIYCSITEDNIASISLFEKQGFKKMGLQIDWIYNNGVYKNVNLYQCIIPK